MATENICGICCVNCVSDTLNCSGCFKAVCVECYNKTRSGANKDIGDIKKHSFQLPDKIIISEIETIDKPISCSYRCPYCRCDNIKNYDDLTRDELLIFTNRDYLTHKDIERANIKLRVKVAELEEDIERLGNEFGYKGEDKFYKERLRMKDAEIVKMASNFNTMINTLIDFENIKKERQTAIYELQFMRENYKQLNIDNINKSTRLDDINNIITSKIPPKKAIERIKKSHANNINMITKLSVNINLTTI